MADNPTRFRLPLGRVYFVRYLLDRLVLVYLSRCARRHVDQDQAPLAIFSSDYVGNSIYVRGTYELEHLAATMGWLQQAGFIRGAALDIGANIGNHSRYFSRFYQKVYGFEPNPKTYQLYRFNAQQAGKVTAYNFGLSDRSGIARLQTIQDNAGGSRIVTGGETGANVEQIELKTLDTVAAAIAEPIGLMKIDVEGHELSVLKGARETILKHKPVILFEQSAEDFQDGLSPVVEHLRSLGYASFATVMPSPYLPFWLPGILRPLLTTIARLIVGFQFVVRTQEKMTPDYYPFLVALPPPPEPARK